MIVKWKTTTTPFAETISRVSEDQEHEEQKPESTERKLGHRHFHEIKGMEMSERFWTLWGFELVGGWGRRGTAAFGQSRQRPTSRASN